MSNPTKSKSVTFSLMLTLLILTATYGPFFVWGVNLFGDGVQFTSTYYGSSFEATDMVLVDGAGFGGLQGNKGVWTEQPISTPELGTLVLLGVGLAGVLLRKRKKPAISANWEHLA